MSITSLFSALYSTSKIYQERIRDYFFMAGKTSWFGSVRACQLSPSKPIIKRSGDQNSNTKASSLHQFLHSKGNPTQYLPGGGGVGGGEPEREINIIMVKRSTETKYAPVTCYVLADVTKGTLTQMDTLSYIINITSITSKSQNTYLHQCLKVIVQFC